MNEKKENRGLNGKKVAILVANGFEEDELTSPRKAFGRSGGANQSRFP
jgi:putative intracellular protease/amidase